MESLFLPYQIAPVATVLTVYGIETIEAYSLRDVGARQLQQSLPFTVLKRYKLDVYENDVALGCNSPYRLRY